LKASHAFDLLCTCKVKSSSKVSALLADFCEFGIRMKMRDFDDQFGGASNLITLDQVQGYLNGNHRPLSKKRLRKKTKN